MKLDFRQRLLTSTLLVGASMLASPAFAQTATPNQPGTAQDTQSTVPDQNTATNPAAAQPTGPVEAGPAPTRNAQGAPVQTANDIIITGTRIPQPNLTSAAPVTVVTNQDVKLSGSTRIEDVLNQLPSVQANQGSGVSNGATGTATVDLRDLGPKRTLVLINGRRLVPGDPNTRHPGRRPELHPVGADQARRRADRRRFVGLRCRRRRRRRQLHHGHRLHRHPLRRPVLLLPAQQQLPEHPDFGGQRRNRLRRPDRSSEPGPQGLCFPARAASPTAARSTAPCRSARRSTTTAVTRWPILATAKSIRSCSSAATIRPAVCRYEQQRATPRCGGSATSDQGNALIFADAGTSIARPSSRSVRTERSFRVGSLYNFNPTNYFQRPDERYTGGAFADYEVSPAVHPYMEFMFMNDHTLAQIAPSGDFGNTYTINCDNPFMSAQARGVICDPNNLINGFLGSFPLAHGRAATIRTRLHPPVTSSTARGNDLQPGLLQPASS